MGPRHECPGRTAPHRLGDGEVKLGTRGLPTTEPPRPDAALEPATRDPRPAGALGLCPALASSAQKVLCHPVSLSSGPGAVSSAISKHFTQNIYTVLQISEVLRDMCFMMLLQSIFSILEIINILNLFFRGI